ncbi:MAG TPA: hypothetical protein PKD24_13145 [Pyrinomonadaceae bacterium]|nr:hypothetical protein [Pyrinomonadaceae bacterium]HMP67080.1 hypothetical protein [Pyrinomonadaceae bacterium]
MNTLYYGDNLKILRDEIDPESVDLIYLDPPFNSKRNYNQMDNNVRTEDRAQAQACMDTWMWDDHANLCYEEILSNWNGAQTRQSNSPSTVWKKPSANALYFPKPRR